MKNALKNLSALVFGLVLSLGLSAAAFADGSVEYVGGAEKFLFLDGSEFSDTDLFGSFKNVFPGDVIEQTVTVKNGFFGPDSVRIYLKAIAHDSSNPIIADTDETLTTMEDFLSQLRLTVSQNGKVILDASPDQTGGLTENVFLGDFPNGSSTKLTLTLSVPAELGNDYADRMGEVDWVFTAEEIPEHDKPKTGDSGVIIWLLTMGQSFAVAVSLYSAIKRKSE